MRLLVTTLVIAHFGLLALAAENPLAGSWKLNTAKSTGPAPACVQDGVLRIRPEIFTGSSNHKPAEEATGAGSKSAKCAGVYQFTPSPDGRTLTLTQPQVDPDFKAVFEKQ